MPTPFPGIQPTDRRFSPMKWPTTNVRSRSGFSSVRLWGSRPSGAVLDLQFRHITDAQTVDLLSAYHNAKGPVDSLTIPTIVFQGASTTLRNWLNASSTGAGVTWHFAPDGEPQVVSIAPNVNTVSTKLTAELRLP